MMMSTHTLTALAALLFVCSAARAGGALALPAGTSVLLTVDQPLSSEEVQIGQPVELRVLSDVTVGGKTLIAAGSPAAGKITDVTRTCPGCPARCSELVITVKTVRAVDGQHVALRGLPITIRGECCGMCHEPVVVERGCPLPAETQHQYISTPQPPLPARARRPKDSR